MVESVGGVVLAGGKRAVEDFFPETRSWLFYSKNKQRKYLIKIFISSFGYYNLQLLVCLQLLPHLLHFPPIYCTQSSQSLNLTKSLLARMGRATEWHYYWYSSTNPLPRLSSIMCLISHFVQKWLFTHNVVFVVGIKKLKNCQKLYFPSCLGYTWRNMNGHN